MLPASTFTHFIPPDPMDMRRCGFIGLTMLAGVVSVFTGGATAASYQDDIGFTALKQLLGNSISTGAGVNVMHVEASEVDYNGALADSQWKPNPGLFSGKTFTFSPGLGNFSGHANGVGQLFYGSDSIAPGVTIIEAYLADTWLGSDFLNGSRRSQLPRSSSARVANHSWVGTYDPSPPTADQIAEVGDLLRRLDWVVETSETTHVVGMNNGANVPLLGSSFNAIAVGRTDGGQATGTDSALPAPYGTARTKPDIVAPKATTSEATPIVAAAAALLIEKGHGSASTITNAERSETVKAALMAGANRETHNQSTSANISDYRSAAHQTANGLDNRYGAGQMNIQNSYQIIAGGEHNSGDMGCTGSVLCAGFDYDEAFGGGNNSNNTAEYFFSTQAGFDWLFSAALVWNIDIASANGDVTGNATLHNLDLQLIDLTGGNTIVGSSTSTVDNTENLWLPLQASHSYALKVLAQGPAFEWDYALAWRLSGTSATTAPLPGGVWLLGSALPVLLSRRRRR